MDPSLSKSGPKTNQKLPAASLHLDLRDSAGLKVPVKVFHVVVPNSSFLEGSGHLIGIQEEGNAFDSPHEASFLQPPEEADHSLHEPVFASEPDFELQEDLASGCSSEDWSYSLDKLIVDIEAFSRNLNIKRATLCFKDCRECDTPGLVDYLSSRSQVAVVNVTQGHTNEVLQSMSALEELYKERVTLCLPTPLGGRMRMACTGLLCSMDAPKDANSTELPMKLEFQGITRCRSHSRSSRPEGYKKAGTAASSASSILPNILEGATVAE